MKREPNASENEVMNIARASENSQLVVRIWKSDDGDRFGIWRQIPGQADRTPGLLQNGYANRCKVPVGHRIAVQLS